MKRLPQKRKIALVALLATVAGCASSKKEVVQQYSLSNKANERAELIAKLRRDLIKVDRAIGVTEKLIASSRSAPYLPDLFFRQAELYVEKSRYRFHLEAELNAEANKNGSLVVPDVALLKQKAISVYERIVREFPDYKENDKVRFFTAHEYRELGQYDKAIRTYQDVVDQHPKSPLAPEALLIIADYHFDKSRLDEAEKYYLKILDTPPSPAHDLARYKMGWVWINRGKHGEAVKYFEAAARSAVVEGASAKALQVKGLALSDLVYSYTESRPAKGAIEFFEGLCDGANSFEMVLEKLGNRYFIKQEFENAAPAYRRLLTISRDFERDPERASRLYETIKASKGKVIPRADDVKAIVRVAARARVDQRMSAKDRTELLDDLEIYSRDLSTKLHTQAQEADRRGTEKPATVDSKKIEDDSKEDRQVKRMYSEAADAYEAYLDLFRNEKHRMAMMKNRAEALFNAGRYAESGRQYEEVAKKVDGPAREEPLYSTLVAFQLALRTPDKLSYFDRVDSRSGIRQLGAFYVKNFPRSEHAAKVKFNMARAFYDDGMFKESGDLFTAYALEYPSDSEASVAADLALDSFHNMKDFKGMTDAGNRLLKASLPAGKLAEIQKLISAAKTEELSEVVIATDTGSEDAISRLMKIADDPARANSDVAERALANAFSHSVAKRDLQGMREIAQKIFSRYPKTGSAANAVLTLARFATEMGDFDTAAQYLESMNDSFPGDPKALEALDSAGTVRLMMGDFSRAVSDFEKVASATKRGEAYAKLAEARLAANNLPGTEQAAIAALEADPGLAKAAAFLGEALLAQGRASEAEERIVAAGRNLQKSAASDPEALAKVYFLWGEAAFKQFRDTSDIEKKAAILQRLQQAYTSAAQMGGDWAIAGMYRLGQALSMLSDSLSTMPEPAGLNDRQRTELRSTLQKQSADLKSGAEEAFSTCVKKARELEVYTPFAAGCMSRREVNSKLPSPPGMPPTAADRLKDFRQALEKNGSDAAAIEGLGRAYLAAGDLRRARLVFTRLIEVDENNLAAHRTLGFIFLRLGEPDSARSALKKAIELNSHDEKAHANMAALMCRFGDPEGAKNELSLVKSSLNAPDIDPDYAACRK